jgi:hypothetical protein
MTRRRNFLMTALLALLGGCAAMPDDAPVVEQLDEQTGLTIARLGKPLELYRENFRQETAGKFAFLGPFETNQMGKRETWLWLALPLENSDSPVMPLVAVNGAPLKLGEPGRAPDAAGLHQPPYKIPMTWIAMFYYRIDDATIAQLGEARSIRLQVTENIASGPLTTVFSAPLADDPRLRDFAAHQRN